VNVAYDPDMIDALVAAGHVTAAFDPEDDLEPAIGRALAETPDADVLFQTGAVGIEPIVYVLGPDAPTVAGVVRDLA
jgi:predicted fused transcriptional regulator/phosphomethylpyrimidine kinase